MRAFSRIKFLIIASYFAFTKSSVHDSSRYLYCKIFFKSDNSSVEGIRYNRFVKRFVTLV